MNQVEICAAMRRAAMLEAEARQIREGLNHDPVSERLRFITLYADGYITQDEFKRLYNNTLAPASCRFKPGDRVRVKITKPYNAKGIVNGRVGTVVGPDSRPGLDVQVQLDAPALPGEWRDWPDGPGWWVAMHTPEIRTHGYINLVLITTMTERAVIGKGQYGNHLMFDKQTCQSSPWLRLPDLPPPPPPLTDSEWLAHIKQRKAAMSQTKP
jgi:hypothetical protein